MDYSKKQEVLQKTASSILVDLNLIEFLGKYGIVQIVGSMALGLMDKEDIDVIVSTTPDYKDYISTVEYLFTKEKVYSLNLQDFRKSIFAGRPQGIYCGVTYLLKPSTFWKIDIWFFSKENGEKSAKAYASIKSKLTEENKKIIMNLKKEMKIAFPENKEIGSFDVYKAVLEQNAQTWDDFKKYLKT